MSDSIKFISPVDGDMLNASDGVFENGAFVTRVSVSAPQSGKITINGIAAAEENGVFFADIKLSEGENVITAENGAGEQNQIQVGVLPKFAGYYRVSIDDAVWFLRDITDHRYPSLFNNPFLSLMKEVHNAYKTKIHINIYYKDGDTFTLKQVPDIYRQEWENNADWLRLSFHAKSNEPANPYENASYDEMKNDVLSVKEQIKRFAGEKLMGPVTTLHWGAATRGGCSALRDSGYSVLVGDFNVDNGKTPVSYYFDVEQRRHINRRYIWRDNSLGITFFRSAIIIDTHKLSEITGFLDEIKTDPHRSAYFDLLIHEQYFYPSYPAYQPDYRDKVLTAVNWAVKNGYQPAFLDECLF